MTESQKRAEETFKYMALEKRDEMKAKKGYIISYGDWFKGFFIGAIVGGVLAYLFFKGILKIPVMPAKEAAKAALLLPLFFKK